LTDEDIKRERERVRGGGEGRKYNQGALETRTQAKNRVNSQVRLFFFATKGKREKGKGKKKGGELQPYSRNPCREGVSVHREEEKRK
jgi:hypothetical protein